MKTIEPFVNKYRYLILSVFIVILMIISTLHGYWVGDFWEHSAVVRELATNTLNPRHPLFLSEKAHPFYSPYLLLVGLFSKYLSSNPIEVLSFFAIFNLVFFLLSLYLFIKIYFKKHTNIISFYTIIFIIFFWPSKSTWFWSGFYHFRVLRYVLPYPSFFSGAMTFFIFCLYVNFLKRSTKYLFFIISTLLSIVMLTHPPTAIFTIVGIFSISISDIEKINIESLKFILLPFSIFICAILISLMWPYYSFYSLISSSNPEFHKQSYVLYRGLKGKLYPFTITLPILFYRVKIRKNDALILMFTGGVAVYFIGYLTANYGAGRIISYLGIVNQIALADFITKMELKVRQQRYTYIIPIILIFFITFTLNTKNIYTLNNMLFSNKNSYSNYVFLSDFVNQYDVVLSDIGSSWMVPTFGGKIIASPHPVYWINDNEDRKRDLKKFFDNNSTCSDKMKIIKKYNAKFVLIDKKKFGNVVRDCIFGESIYENTKFILLSVSKL